MSSSSSAGQTIWRCEPGPILHVSDGTPRDANGWQTHDWLPYIHCSVPDRIDRQHRHRCTKCMRIYTQSSPPTDTHLHPTNLHRERGLRTNVARRCTHGKRKLATNQLPGVRDGVPHRQITVCQGPVHCGFAAGRQLHLVKPA